MLTTLLLLMAATPVQIDQLPAFLDNPAEICEYYGKEYAGGDFPTTTELTYFSRNSNFAVVEHGLRWYAQYSISLPGQRFLRRFEGNTRRARRVVYCK